MPAGIRVGDGAPDFELDGTDGRFRLSEHRGERVVLLFYPGDETPVCTKQFCSYRDNADEMAELDATIVGISPQDVDSHRSFIEHHDLTVPLLADTDVEVSKAYGVTRPWQAGRLHAGVELGDLEVVGIDPVDRRQRAAENVVAAAVLVRALDRDHIPGLLDHADQPGVAALVLADAAARGVGQVEADLAQPDA